MRESAVIPQQDHKSLVQEIDIACIGATFAATNIRNWLFQQRGPYMPYFSGSPGVPGFYSQFSVLFMLTSRLSEMKQHSELIEQIDKWLVPVRMGKNREQDIQRMQEGIGLFLDYYNKLGHSGVVTLRK